MLRRVAPGLKDSIHKKWKKFERIGKKNGNRYTIDTPEDDVTIERLLTRLRPYKYDVIIIDYATLLAYDSSEAQWKAISDAARYSKRFASNNDCVVVLLAQISDEEIVRYSRALKEHASNMWTWVYTEEEAETHILEIAQQKARNQKKFSFYVKENFATMTIKDYVENDNDDTDELAEPEPKPKKKKKKRKKEPEKQKSKKYKGKKFSKPKTKLPDEIDSYIAGDL